MMSKLQDTLPPAELLPSVAPQAQAVAHQWRRLARASQAPWLHTEVARRLGDKLDAIRLTPTDWLDWSATLGGGAAVVMQRYPQSHRWVWEPTAELARRASQAWQSEHARPWWAAWRKQPSAPVVHAAQPWPEGWPSDGVGLVWANMALHAQSDLDATLRAWHAALAVDGFLMCSGLGPDTARELRALYQALGWPVPTIQFIDMHDLGDALVQAGFADPVMDMERLTLTWDDAHAMLTELRTWGGNVAVGRFVGCRTPRWRQRLVDAIHTTLRRPDGRIGLTVELVYGHAIKPLPRALVSEETRVSLNDMKRMIKGGSRQP